MFFAGSPWAMVWGIVSIVTGMMAQRALAWMLGGRIRLAWLVLLGLVAAVLPFVVILLFGHPTFAWTAARELSVLFLIAGVIQLILVVVRLARRGPPSPP